MSPLLVDALADLTPASAICLGTAAFALPLVPWLLLVDADHLTPRWVREAPDSVRAAAERAALSYAVLLLLLTAPKGATR